jgi:TRAP-type uncharacterized transport system substrate-binding protein
VFGSVALLALAAWALWQLAPPPAPKRIVMTTGAKDGAYHAYAQRYRDELAAYGIELELRPSRGAAENLERLKTGADGVEVGLVQGGLVRGDDAAGLVTLGSLFYEPIWLFYRGRDRLGQIAELRGRRVAIGAPGSGTHALGTAIAADNGLQEAPTTILETGGLDAADALIAGDIDAVLSVSAIEGAAVQKLLAQAPRVRLMDMRRADAYVRRLPYLHKVVLPEGVIDLKRGIPPQEVTMVALAANLVAREQIHPVAVELLLMAAREVHGGPTLLHPAGVFPAPHDVDLPLSADAERFYKERPSLLRRLLPFWVAVWVERTLFVALPLIALAVPVFAYLPKVYDWRIRSRLHRWYLELVRIERDAAAPGANLVEQRARLDAVDAKLHTLKIPKSYLRDLYTLREHALYVRSTLDRA